MDETIGWLHARNNPIPTQDQSELRIILLQERISGLVVFRVDVDTKGQVIAVNPLNGPRELTAVYADEAKHITFYPFMKNGKTVCARFKLRYAGSSSFSNDPDAKTYRRLMPLLNKCSAASAKSKPDALPICQQAAEAADGLSIPIHNKDRVAAYNYFASALLLDNRPKEALTYAEKAVAASDLGFLPVSDKAAAYGLRGQARGLTGDPAGADLDLTKAEELEWATFEVPRTQQQRNFDSGVLGSILNFHSQILMSIGKTAEAKQLHDAAQKLL